MKYRLKTILRFLLGGPALIGDVNLRYVPMPIIFIWYGFVKLWYCVPIISRRSRYNELKEEAAGSKYWIKYMKEAQDEAKEYKALADEYEYELRQLKQFETILIVKKKVSDKETYGYPQRSYNDDYSTEPRSTISSLVIKPF